MDTPTGPRLSDMNETASCACALSCPKVNVINLLKLLPFHEGLPWRWHVSRSQAAQAVSTDWMPGMNMQHLPCVKPQILCTALSRVLSEPILLQLHLHDP